MEIDQNLIKLSDVCRTCLTCDENMTSLLDSGQESSDFIKKLSIVSNLEIIISPEYPCNTCSACTEKINSFYEFQQLCQRSNQIIISLSKQSKSDVNVNTTAENEIQENSTKASVDEGSFLDDERESPFSDNIENVGSNNAKINLFDNEIEFQQSNDCDNIENEEVLNSRQGLKLKQFNAKEVERVIREAREKFYSQVRCVVCNVQTANIRALSVHMTRIHKDAKKSWCVSCNEFYSDLEKHNEQQHSDHLKCPFCQKKKLNMGHFIEHVMGHSGDKQHQCHICQKCYVSARKLRLHKETHVMAFNCPTCLQGFRNKRALQQHIKNLKNCQDAKGENVVEQERLLVQLEPHNFCKDCNKKVRSLPEHIKLRHMKKEFKDDEKKNLCPFCGKQFTSPAKLNIHIRVHTGETPYQCRYCDKKARTRTVMMSHERTHTGEKPYVCSDCGKSFAQSSIRNTHRKLHTGKTEQCLICQQRFCRPSELRIHMRKHTGEKPYQCKVCNESFNQKSHLRDHGKTHTKERPHQCEFCDKMFRHMSSLKTHRTIHLGQKPHKCPQCPYACRQSFSLTKHMKQHISGKLNKDKTQYICNLCRRQSKSISHFLIHYSKCHGQINVEDVPNAAESITLYSEDAAVSEEISDVNPVVNVENVSYVENIILCTDTIDCQEAIEMPSKNNIYNSY